MTGSDLEKYRLLSSYDNPIVDSEQIFHSSRFYSVVTKYQGKKRFNTITDAFSYANSLERDFVIYYVLFLTPIQKWVVFRRERYQFVKTSQLSLFN